MVLSSKYSRTPLLRGSRLSRHPLYRRCGQRGTDPGRPLSVGTVPKLTPHPSSAGLSGEHLAAPNGWTSPSISSWPALCRPSTPLGSDRREDVDARIKSAQDDFKSLPTNSKHVTIA